LVLRSFIQGNIAISVERSASVTLRNIVENSLSNLHVQDGRLELVTSEGDVLDQPNTCCRYLASLTELDKQLLGDTPEQQATISDWLSRRHTTLAHLTEEHLAEVCTPCGSSVEPMWHGCTSHVVVYVKPMCGIQVIKDVWVCGTHVLKGWNAWGRFWNHVVGVWNP
jgi:predicted RNA-binding Zn-ribbon protein involved in translation (DUF1610 family)